MGIKQNIRLTVDVVLIAFSDKGLEVLLIQRNDGSWALPGGFVDDKEELKVAAKRELKEETGISVDELIQFYTYGDDVNRDPRGHTVSVAHLVVLSKTTLEVQAASDAKDAKWVNINQIPALAFDHNKIVHDALTHLKISIRHQLPDLNVIINGVSKEHFNEIAAYLKVKNR